MSHTVSEIEYWINPAYLQEFRAGTLHLRRVVQPFANAVLPSFFTPQALEQMLQTAAQTPVEAAHRKGIAAKTDWHWGAFANLDFVRFFLSGEMRSFLEQLMGVAPVIKKRAVPQFNLFRPESPGIPIHTDSCENVGLVSLIQLSQGYQPGRGGELVLYRQENGRLQPDRSIPPLCNTLIVFQVSEHSYHGVNDMSGEWTRRTITYDWLAERDVRANGSV